MNNMRVLGTGMLAYSAQWEGALPWDGYGEGDRAARPVGFWNDPSLWFNAGPQYAGARAYSTLQDIDLAGGTPLPGPEQQSLFACPEATGVTAGLSDTAVNDYFLMWGWDPAAAPAQNPVTRKTYWCYGFNTDLDSGVEDRHVTYRVTIHVGMIPRPSETVLVAEKLMRPNEFNPPFATSVAQSEVSWKELTTRHDGGGFLLLVDGHVAWFSHADVASPPGAPWDYNQPGKVIWSPNTPAQ